ncbi:uncharacterized protein LOC111137750 isoform X1 [Crassostrea virginica]
MNTASFRVLEQHRASLSDDAADGADQGPGCSDRRPSKRSTPRKEDADGAHNQDPPPDDAADGSTTGTHHRMELSSELHISFIIFVASANQCGISFSRKFQSLGAAPSQLE